MPRDIDLKELPRIQQKNKFQVFLYQFQASVTVLTVPRAREFNW